MKSILQKATLVLAAVLYTVMSYGQGSTTSSIKGLVTDQSGEPLIAATVLAVHTPSGTSYGTVTREDGQYTIPNARVGGPYTVTSSYVGYEEQKQEGIMLYLGNAADVDFKLSDGSVTIDVVEVVANRSDLLSADKTGTGTNIGEEAIQALPTVARDISDFTRLTPQASITEDGGISIAGANNRYNSIFIDGAVSNDVFGLSDQGTNGGQTGVSPISVDAIEQFEVVLSPYDVSLGGFTGGGINAVTRSGSNNFEGSAYFFMRNEGLAGKTPTDDENVEREQLDDFDARTFGFRLGGPIIKNKLFFFVNTEIQRDQTPQPFSFSDYEGDATEDNLNSLRDHLISTYGYDPGDGFLNNTRELRAEKFLIRFDYNLAQGHQLSLRHNFSKGRSIQPASTNPNTINYFNNGVYFPSVTNSTTLELNSVFGEGMSNNLIIGYTNVNDDRDPLGDAFPRVTIRDGSGQIRFGSEIFSTGNQLKQSVLTITDKFNLYKGKHTLTFGTHNEIFSIYNLFIRRAFGEYEFNSISDFTAGNPIATDYEVSYSLVEGDNIVGDGSAAGAEFGAMQLGFYAQDEFAVNEQLTVTGGIRFDVPMFLSSPKENTKFNDETIATLEAAGKDLQGAKAGQMPKSSVMISPRIGFNYDIMGDRSTVIRGGIGLFTGRVPFVWPGGAFANNGLSIGATFASDSIPFRADPNNQYSATDFGRTDAVPSGQMDLFASDFKYPQVLRTSLGFDRKLPAGIVATLEGMFTKTYNNIVYQNLNIKDATEFTSGAGKRPIFDRGDAIDDTYSRIMLGYNTNEGYSYNFTAQLQKPFNNGFTASLAYTYGESKVVNDGTSSQNSSNWRYMEAVNGKNDIGLSYSDFDLGSRVVGMLSYRLEYLKHAATTISFVYNGQSGQRFSYVYNGRIANDDSAWGTDLVYVPKDQSEIAFVDIYDNDGNLVANADDQWNDFNEFIENDNHLSTRRGDFAERNGGRLEFQHMIDMKLVQDIFFDIKGKRQTLQVTFDVFNFGNLLNPNWGRQYRTANNAIQLLDYRGLDGDNVPQFQFEKPDGTLYFIDDAGISSSRWQAQLGVRYLF